MSSTNGKSSRFKRGRQVSEYCRRDRILVNASPNPASRPKRLMALSKRGARYNGQETVVGRIEWPASTRRGIDANAYTQILAGLEISPHRACSFEFIRLRLH